MSIFSKNNTKTLRVVTIPFALTLSSFLLSGSAVGAPLVENFDYPLSDLPTYEPMWEARETGKSAVYENEQATLTLDYTGVGRNRLSLADGSPTDSIAATLTLSSESRVDAGGRIAAEVAGFFYNDIQDGGNDGYIGDVFARTRLYQDDEGLKTMFCASRADSADFGQDTTLGPNGSSECGVFEFTPEFDTPYRASVSLNRTDKTLVYRLGDEEHSIAITTELFTPSEHYSNVRARVFEGTGKVVLGIDDVKTDNIDDDFSYNSLPLLLVRGFGEAERGGEVLNGKIRLSASEAPDFYNSSRLRIFSKVEESISATVNVSSESTEAGEIRARFKADMFHSGSAYDSDTPENGNNIARMEVRFNPDGSKSVQACHFEVIAGDEQTVNCDQFSTIPEYDTDYQMSVSIDRDNSKLVFGLDDEVVEIPVATSMNTPYIARTYISADARVGTAVITYDNLRVDCPSDSQVEKCQPRSSGRDVIDTSGGSDDSSGSGSSGGGGSLGWGTVLLLAVGLCQRKRRIVV